MKKLLVFTGAGISAESGLQTFRDADGLWEGYDVEEVATADAWKRQPDLVQEFYNMRRKQVLEANPNKAHQSLAEAEKEYEVFIITQNVDDLHERAGSSNIIHLHGELMKSRSEKNPDMIYPIAGDIHMGDMAEDGSQLRPHIVLFGESVPMMDTALSHISSADALLVIGTSLQVYPAASIVSYFPKTKPIILLDKKIPSNLPSHIHSIEKSATEGIDEALSSIRSLLS